MEAVSESVGPDMGPQRVAVGDNLDGIPGEMGPSGHGKGIPPRPRSPTPKHSTSMSRGLAGQPWWPLRLLWGPGTRRTPPLPQGLLGCDLGQDTSYRLRPIRDQARYPAAPLGPGF